MAEGGKRELLSIGIFLMILVVSIILYVVDVIVDWLLIPPLILALYGCWTIVLAGIRASNPQKYERGSFSTFALGLILMAIGGAWFTYSIEPLFSLAVVLLALGALTITAALKGK